MGKLLYITETQLNILKEILSEANIPIPCLGKNYASVQHLVHDLKSGDINAIDTAGILLSKHVNRNSVLIPIPQHTGKAEYTLKLANRISQITGAVVVDVLTMSPRENSLFRLKNNKKKFYDINLGFEVLYDEKIAKMLKTANNVILIDNVIDSGTTVKQAIEAIRNVYDVNPWPLALGVVTRPKYDDGSIIRSTFE